MAKIKYSALVSEMRNKLNGSVASKNRYGNYLRNKVTPVNPQTSFQQAARQRLGNLSASWRELTQAQRNSFIDGTQNMPVTDIFGDIQHLSGQALFIRLNGNLEKVGQPRIDVMPELVGFPEVAITSVTATATAGALTALEVDTAINGAANAAIPAGYSLAVYATDAVPAGIEFVKQRFRFLGTATQTADEPLDLTAQWNARFGAIQSGARIFVRLALVANSSGQQSVPVEGIGSLS